VGIISIKQAVEDLEKDMIRQALINCRHNQRKAAAHVGLTYDQFRGKIRKYGPAVSGRDD
jgi:DNA-binding NtrC family response regulator